MVTKTPPPSRVSGGPRKQPATKVTSKGARPQKAVQPAVPLPQKKVQPDRARSQPKTAPKAAPRTIQSIDAARFQRAAKAQQNRVMGQKLDTAAALNRKAEAALKRGNIDAYRDLRLQREQAIIADREKAKETSRTMISTAAKAYIATKNPREIPKAARDIENRSNVLRKEILAAQKAANKETYRKLTTEKTKIDQHLRKVTVDRNRKLVIPEAKKLVKEYTPFLWLKDAKNMSAEAISASLFIDTLAAIPLVGLAVKTGKAVLMTAPKVKKIGSQVFDEGAKANPNLRYLYNDKAKFLQDNAEGIANISNMARGLPPNAPKRVKVADRDPVQEKRIKDAIDAINSDKGRKSLENLKAKAPDPAFTKKRVEEMLERVNDLAKKEKIAKTKLANEQLKLQKLNERAFKKQDRKSVSKQKQKKIKAEQAQKADVASIKRTALGRAKQKARKAKADAAAAKKLQALALRLASTSRRERVKQDVARIEREAKGKRADEIKKAMEDAQAAAAVDTKKTALEAIRRKVREAADAKEEAATKKDKKDEDTTTKKDEAGTGKKEEVDPNKKKEKGTGKKEEEDTGEKEEKNTGKKPKIIGGPIVVGEEDDKTGEDDDTGAGTTTTPTPDPPPATTPKTPPARKPDAFSDVFEEATIAPRLDERVDNIPDRPVLDPVPRTPKDEPAPQRKDDVIKRDDKRGKPFKGFRSRVIKKGQRRSKDFTLPKPALGIPDNYYANRITFLNGFTRFFVDLTSGQSRAIRSQKTGSPKETFRVLYATPKKPDPRKIPLGFVSIRIDKKGVYFTKRRPVRSRLFKSRG